MVGLDHRKENAMSRIHIAFEGQIDYFVQHSHQRLLDLLHGELDMGALLSTAQAESFTPETNESSRPSSLRRTARTLRGRGYDESPTAH
jgi:hypothetical protein